MLNAVTKPTGANEWSVLLDETRMALSTLRAQELDELAARADCMLSATLGQDSIRQRMPRPREQDLLEVGTRNRLLSDLLMATKTNIEVLRRPSGYDRVRVREANSLWVR